MLRQWRAERQLPTKGKRTKPRARRARAASDAPSVQREVPRPTAADKTAATQVAGIHEKVGLPAIIPVQPTPAQPLARPRRADAPEDKANGLVEFLGRDLSLGEMVEVLQLATIKATQMALGHREKE
jgi:hypothetical protein